MPSPDDPDRFTQQGTRFTEIRSGRRTQEGCRTVLTCHTVYTLRHLSWQPGPGTQSQPHGRCSASHSAFAILWGRHGGCAASTKWTGERSCSRRFFRRSSGAPAGVMHALARGATGDALTIIKRDLGLIGTTTLLILRSVSDLRILCHAAAHTG